jgi:hypothetical protein
METRPMLASALRYGASDWSVIPLKPCGKEPMIAWKVFQERRASAEEIREWFESTDYNVGIVTGAVSGLAVIDCDGPEAIDLARRLGMPPCPTVRTARGMHFYFAYEEGLRNFQRIPELPGIDLRAEGGFVVAPPSVHPSGFIYRWEVE